MERAAPEALGFSSKKLRLIGPAMRRYIDQGRIPGLVTIITRRGKIAYADSQGLMDVADGRPMALDTLFQIQSITKPIACLAVMILYEEGRLRLDEPVERFIPAFKKLSVLEFDPAGQSKRVKLARPVTIHHLLTHTSGLSYASQSSPAKAALHAEVDIARPGSTLRDRVERLLQLPLDHQPGERWRYGFSVDVLAYLVELIAGCSFDVFLKERLFAPLGMADTGGFVPGENAGRMAMVYKLAREGALQLYETPESAGLLNPDRPLLGSTGLISSAPDFLRLAQMLLNGGELDGKRLLAPETVRLMTESHLAAALLPTYEIVGMADHSYTAGYGYGYGVKVLLNPAQSGAPGSAGGYGWFGAYNTYFWIDPTEQIIALAWAQTYTFPYYRLPLDRELRALAYRALVRAEH